MREIRSIKDGFYYWVNLSVNSCSHISSSDKCVYSALASFDGCSEIRPSFETIAERSSVSLRQAKRSIKKLISVGYVELLQGGGRGKANVYNLLRSDKGCQFCTVSNSKPCQNVPQTVPNKSVNSATVALQLDKEIDKNNIRNFLTYNKERKRIEEERKKLQEKGVL